MAENTFTVEVGKKTREEEFGFEDLELSHQECFGGKIREEQYYQGKSKVPGSSWTPKQKHPPEINDPTYDDYVPGWKLTCLRCGIARLTLEGIEILKTAVDGQEREAGENITVVQKS